MQLDKLNKRAAKLLKGNLAKKYLPYVNNFDAKVLICPRESVAFYLKSPASPCRLVAEKSIEDEESAVLRVIIPDEAQKHLKHVDTFNYYISCIINSALVSLTKEVGDLHNRAVIAERPGGAYPEYFRLTELGDLELRFYLTKKEHD